MEQKARGGGHTCCGIRGPLTPTRVLVLANVLRQLPYQTAQRKCEIRTHKAPVHRYRNNRDTNTAAANTLAFFRQHRSHRGEGGGGGDQTCRPHRNGNTGNPGVQETSKVIYDARRALPEKLEQTKLRGQTLPPPASHAPGAKDVCQE